MVTVTGTADTLDNTVFNDIASAQAIRVLSALQIGRNAGTTGLAAWPVAMEKIWVFTTVIEFDARSNHSWETNTRDPSGETSRGTCQYPGVGSGGGTSGVAIVESVFPPESTARSTFAPASSTTFHPFGRADSTWFQSLASKGTEPD